VNTYIELASFKANKSVDMENRLE